MALQGATSMLSTTSMEGRGICYRLPRPGGESAMRTTRPQIFLAAALTVAAGLALPLAQGRTGGAPAAAPATQRGAAQAAGQVTSPKQEWGHNVGDDYFLANYQQVIA